MMILAIDPGKDKCGLAVLDDQARVKEHIVIVNPKLNLVPTVMCLVTKFSIQTLVLGQGTFSAATKQLLTTMFPDLKIVLVDEANSTLEARKLYWQDNPAKGLLKLIPQSLRVPPRPIDDYAAVVVGKRFVDS